VQYARALASGSIMTLTVVRLVDAWCEVHTAKLIAVDAIRSSDLSCSAIRPQVRHRDQKRAEPPFRKLSRTDPRKFSSFRSLVRHVMNRREMIPKCTLFCISTKSSPAQMAIQAKSIRFVSDVKCNAICHIFDL
jgi:hypothetical protein